MNLMVVREHYAIVEPVKKKISKKTRMRDARNRI
jgi:hypothetical protein